MKEAIKDFITQNLIQGNVQIELSTEDDLLGSGLIDSMGMMRLIAFIEEQFTVKVPPEDMTLDNFMTIDNIYNYLQSKK